jgi:hypothetical protein
LSLEEAETWKATVGARKAGFFGPEIFPLLEAYCATAMICDRIAAQLRELDEIDHEAYESYDRMTRSLADLAKALCLLPEGERTDAWRRFGLPTPRGWYHPIYAMDAEQTAATG